MTKTILITGSTDGIGLETAKLVAAAGHHVLLHGRSNVKLDAAAEAVERLGRGSVSRFAADLTRPQDVVVFADEVADRLDRLDVLINNAGVFKVDDPVTPDGLDVRFAVNTIAPYLLTRRLLPVIKGSGRIVNLSSAAQAPVNQDALVGRIRLQAGDAYAQSKLALTMWSAALAAELGPDEPMVVAVNPGSLLATKMVKDGYGIAGNDIGIGADILTRAALADEFATASGKYFDNDSGRFAPPHPDALDNAKNRAMVRLIDNVIAQLR